MQWILGGLAGGFAGALIWILVGYFTGFEVGYIAWGIGFLTGAGARYFAWKAEIPESTAQGIGAALIAVGCILLAKLGVVWMQMADFRAGFVEVTDEDVLVDTALDISFERVEQGRPVAWPKGVILELADAPHDFPSDIWAEAEEKWRGLTPEEQQSLRDALRQWRSARFDEMQRGFLQEGFAASFSFFDLLWLGLAVVTAYKMGAGSYSTE